MRLMGSDEDWLMTRGCVALALSGVTRITITLSVILFETTNGEREAEQLD